MKQDDDILSNTDIYVYVQGLLGHLINKNKKQQSKTTQSIIYGISLMDVDWKKTTSLVHYNTY